ncbi:MAG: hypothetical protein L0Y56_04200 [Nitrospira sp.]|nr:hypothetical protein [Nitrospira sp.]
MFLEVEENPNCKGMDMMRFKELGPPKRLKQVRLYDRKDQGEWCQITGWTNEEGCTLCPAYARPIEDSGIGMAYLIYGGNYGIRLKPVEMDEAWNLSSPHQWGEPYLVLTSSQDLMFEEKPELEKK